MYAHVVLHPEFSFALLNEWTDFEWHKEKGREGRTQLKSLYGKRAANPKIKIRKFVTA